jgi:superfamily II DNA/RNA helicase
MFNCCCVDFIGDAVFSRSASTDRPARILVFCNTATTAECVQLSLSQSKQNVGVLAVACHKNVPHLNRAQNFLRFQQGGIPGIFTIYPLYLHSRYIIQYFV